MTLIDLGIAVAGALMSVGVMVIAARLDAVGRKRASRRVVRIFAPLVGAAMVVALGIVRGWAAWQLAAVVAAWAVGVLAGTLIELRGTRRRHG
jgi:hypothetical protein